MTPGWPGWSGRSTATCYLVYLAVAFDITRKLHVRLGWTLLVLLAGTVPFCGFVAENKMTKLFDRVALPVGSAAVPCPSHLARHLSPSRPPPISTPASPAVRRSGERGHQAGAVQNSLSTNRWTNRRALVLHSVLAIWIPACALACWWQVTVALSGDELGWVYSVMWPCFAVFGTVLWWNLIHDDPDTVGARGVRRLQEEEATTTPAKSAPDDDVIARAEALDAELAAYNAYLAELDGGRRRRRGGVGSTRPRRPLLRYHVRVTS